MTSLLAFAMLAAIAVQAIYPESMFSQTLRGHAGGHPRIALGVFGVLGIVLLLIGLVPSSGDKEVDVQGYSELWYMVQTSPTIRDPAREAMADGVLTRHELQSIRLQYRHTTDVATMRGSVAEELKPH